jgi:predicted RNA-binding Zn ribbon-like protein
MYLTDALQRIRQRLVENRARPETLALVDSVLATAQRAGGDQAQVRSLLELVRRLMRTPQANSNIVIYDDLAVLEEQLVQQAAQAAATRAQEEERPLPKPKKYYRQLKERERRNPEES